jgi:hypothetical protein
MITLGRVIVWLIFVVYGIGVLYLTIKGGDEDDN